jgi:RNA polymerase sigma factor (sigma-70 family)
MDASLQAVEDDGRGVRTQESPEADAVREAIDTSLPELQAKVVRAHFIQRMTYEEFAKENGLTLSQVKTLLDKALRKLRHELGAYVTGRDAPVS